MLTILTTATATDLTTLAVVKAELGLTSGTDDAWILQAIARASGQVERCCDVRFRRETVRETIRYEYRWGSVGTPASLRLERYPVLSVSSIIEAGTTLTSDDWEGDADSGYVAMKGALTRLSSDTPTDWASGKIVVEYVAGYLLPGQTGRDLPDDIEAAVIGLVKVSWFARKRDPLVKMERSEGVGETQYWVGSVGDASPGVPDEVAALLDPYRRVLV